MCGPAKLSLLNFDLPSSHWCQYVLTSPRSLRACHKANVKPVELLYRSRAEFAEEGGDQDQLYWHHESNRQKKLARCMRLRNNVIKSEVRRSPGQRSRLSGHHSTTPRPSPDLPPLGDVSPNWTTSGIGTSPELSLIKDLEEVTPRKTPVRVSLAPGLVTEPLTTDFKPFEKRSSSRMRKSCRGTPKKQRASRAANRSQSEERLDSLHPNTAHMLLKYEQIKRNCVERGVRRQEAERAQRDVAEWVQRWQDSVMLEQWAAVTRAQLSADTILRDRVHALRRHNYHKTLNHTINMNKVKEEEEGRAERLRREVEGKGRRIEGLQEERRRAVLETRTRSQTLTDHHHLLREMMTPETFDQKVQKYSVTGRLSGCGTPLATHSSHFILG